MQTKFLVGKPEWKRPLVGRRHRCDDYIKVDLRVIGLGDVDWKSVAQERDCWRALVSTVMSN
jgi:hypothetical protein